MASAYPPDHDKILINGVQVLGEQQPALSDLSALATLLGVINSHNDLLAALRAHGLIAT